MSGQMNELRILVKKIIVKLTKVNDKWRQLKLEDQVDSVMNVFKSRDTDLRLRSEMEHRRLNIHGLFRYPESTNRHNRRNSLVNVNLSCSSSTEFSLTASTRGRVRTLFGSSHCHIPVSVSIQSEMKEIEGVYKPIPGMYKNTLSIVVCRRDDFQRKPVGKPILLHGTPGDAILKQFEEAISDMITHGKKLQHDRMEMVHRGEKEGCPHCDTNKPILLTRDRAGYSCTGCGYVLSSNIVEQDARKNNPYGEQYSSRTSDVLKQRFFSTPSAPGLMSPRLRRFLNKNQTMERLTTFNTKYSHKEQAIINIDNVCEHYGWGRQVSEYAKRLFSEIRESRSALPNKEAFIVACIARAYHKHYKVPSSQRKHTAGANSSSSRVFSCSEGWWFWRYPRQWAIQGKRASERKNARVKSVDAQRWKWAILDETMVSKLKADPQIPSMKLGNQDVDVALVCDNTISFKVQKVIFDKSVQQKVYLMKAAILSEDGTIKGEALETRTVFKAGSVRHQDTAQPFLLKYEKKNNADMIALDFMSHADNSVLSSVRFRISDLLRDCNITVPGKSVKVTIHLIKPLAFKFKSPECQQSFSSYHLFKRHAPCCIMKTFPSIKSNCTSRKRKRR